MRIGHISKNERALLSDIRDFICKSDNMQSLIVQFQHKYVIDGDTTHIFATVGNMYDKFNGIHFQDYKIHECAELSQRDLDFIRSRIIRRE